MPYYKDAKLLFIHIPKTGGRVIEKEICKIYKQTLFTGKTNTILEKPYNSISLQHQFYTTIYKYKDKLQVDFNNIKIFTVVRNPYDRIISDLFWYKLIKKKSTADEVYKIIKNKYLNKNTFDNHNEPQYKFITNENMNIIPNILILKSETLNTENENLNNFIGFNINIVRDNVNKDYSKYINKKTISIINNFYKKDFELFGYDIIKV